MPGLNARNPLTRAALLVTATTFVDALVGFFAAKPFPWVVVIPATLPLTMVVLVALPALSDEGRKSEV